MYDRVGAPELPAPPEEGQVQVNARYVYLVTRLRNRQITMEEATELFALQQGLMRRTAPPPPPPVRPRLAAPAKGAPTAVSATSLLDDENAGLLLLVAAAGVGVMAALIKRLQESPSNSPVGPGAQTAAKPR